MRAFVRLGELADVHVHNRDSLTSEVRYPEQNAHRARSSKVSLSRRATNWLARKSIEEILTTVGGTY